MIGITVEDLMKEQRKRFRRQKAKEAEASVTEDMRFIFQRKPYYMMVNKSSDRKVRAKG